jgi:hypothetical protein
MNARLRAAIALAASTAALGALAAPASANLLSVDPASCGDATTTRAFAPWGDPLSYTLVPGGSFEPGDDAWTLSGGASVDAGNESYYANGAGDGYSLSLPPGSSATSPPVCVSIYRPVFRFFARNAGSPTSSLKVEVLYPGLTGRISLLQLGSITGSSWTPSLPMPVLANFLSVLPGASTSMAFRFTPQGAGGGWSIDDVYVDPYGRR